MEQVTSLNLQVLIFPRKALTKIGSVIESLSMEARMSICNMAIEAGARAGMIAPDEITFEYLRDRPLAPKGELWDRAVSYWKTLKSDVGAVYDTVVFLPLLTFDESFLG